MSTIDNTRRRFVTAFSSGVLANPLGALMPLQDAGAAEMPKLSPVEAAAKALAYTHQSSVADNYARAVSYIRARRLPHGVPVQYFRKSWSVQMEYAIPGSNAPVEAWFKRAG